MVALAIGFGVTDSLNLETVQGRIKGELGHTDVLGGKENAVPLCEALLSARDGDQGPSG